MKPSPYLLFILFLAVIPCKANAEETTSPIDEPLYKTLYENGEYDKAVAVLNDSITHDALNAKHLLFYLASCYIARGDRDNGALVFKRLIKMNPDFQLDTLLTPPKILEIFKTVKSQESSVQFKTLKTDYKTSQVLLAPLGLLPGGTGQFYQRKRVKGALLLTVQAASIAVCVWAGWKKDSRYDSRYGWYEPNKAAYERYTNYARIGFAIGIGSYTLGVLDYFINQNKK
jgi:hypothetical protein